jgi:RHS repeat-associated protein
MARRHVKHGRHGQSAGFRPYGDLHPHRWPGQPGGAHRCGGRLDQPDALRAVWPDRWGAPPTIGFTGHVNDADTGLVYMQQRYYDLVAGRFLSIDLVVTDANTGSSFSRYSYASNSPYKYIDPDGRQSLSGNMPYWSPMTQLEIGTRAWYGNLNQQLSTVTVATASAVTIGVGGSVVGEAVVTRVAGNAAIKNAADVVTIIRAVTKFFSEDSAVAPVARPTPQL